MLQWLTERCALWIVRMWLGCRAASHGLDWEWERCLSARLVISQSFSASTAPSSVKRCTPYLRLCSAYEVRLYSTQTILECHEERWCVQDPNARMQMCKKKNLGYINQFH